MKDSSPNWRGRFKNRAQIMKLGTLLLEKIIPLAMVWGLAIIFWSVFGVFGGRFTLIASVGTPMLLSYLILKNH